MEKIEHNEQGHSGSFYVNSDGSKAAVLEYRKLGKDEIIIDHTHVSGIFKGKGVGKMLVEYAVRWARENNLKVVPQCSFAKAIIEKDETLQDVLH